MSFDGARTEDPASPTVRPGTDPSVVEAPGSTAEPPTGAQRPGGGSRWSARRVLVLFVVAAVVVAFVRAFLVQSFVIPSASMEPTLHVGDRVLVWRVDAGAVHRGDVIVFDGDGVFDTPADPSPGALAAAGRALASALGAPVGENDYVKRVIGLPGERVVCCDAAGRVTVDGRPLVEPYLNGGHAGDMPFSIQVPPGRYWVMGDNRGDSGDSRAHLGDPGGGTVPEDHVIGRVVSVWWPWGHATGVGRIDVAAGGAQEGAP